MENLQDGAMLLLGVVAEFGSNFGKALLKIFSKLLGYVFSILDVWDIWQSCSGFAFAMISALFVGLSALLNAGIFAAVAFFGLPLLLAIFLVLGAAILMAALLSGAKRSCEPY